MFIDHEYIEGLLRDAAHASKEEIQSVLDKSRAGERLTHRDVAMLLQIADPEQQHQLYQIAGEIKQRIYGNRIVVFAPLYISDYCVNNCTYCGYKLDNEFVRRKLNMA